MSKTASNISLADAGASRDLGRSALAYESIDQAFPEVDPGVKPLGQRVLVQIRTPMRTTRGGIAIPEESQETEVWNTQIAKVIELGPMAYRDRDSMEPWPEGDWVKPGAFVRCPKYGGDRWEVPVPDRANENVLFAIFNDLEMIALITGNPLDMVAFIK